MCVVDCASLDCGSWFQRHFAAVCPRSRRDMWQRFGCCVESEWSGAEQSGCCDAGRLACQHIGSWPAEASVWSRLSTVHIIQLECDAVLEGWHGDISCLLSATVCVVYTRCSSRWWVKMPCTSSVLHCQVSLQSNFCSLQFIFVIKLRYDVI